MRVANFLIRTTLLAFSLIWGFQCAALALCDPDSCFLIALGRWLLEHRQLPSADTFTWFLSADKPYIAYQWLTEVLMAQLYEAFHLEGLIYLAATLISLAFLVIPLLVGGWLASPAWCLCPLIFLAFSSASFHFPLRPELFSYLAFSTLVAWEISSLKDFKHRPSLLPTGACFYFLLFMLWANLHSAFLLGLLFLFFLALARFLLLAREARVFAPLALATGGSLCNAYGPALFSYLPILFFLRSNALNAEQMPLKPYELCWGDYLPFSLLSLLFLLTLPPAVKSFRAKKSNFLPLSLALALLGLLFLLAALSCRRLVPFASLIELYGMLLACFSLLSGQNKKGTPLPPQEISTGEEQQASMPSAYKKKLWQKWLKTYAFILASWGGFLLGAENSQKIIRPELPQSTLSFPVPAKALDFLSSGPPPGKRLFNDAQFGDLLLLRFAGKIKVSMDTRFDLYGDEKVLEYWKTANALNDYQKFLESNKVDWLFFPPRAPIIGRLKKEPGWHLVYEDPLAVILVRNK